jgi:superfamily I DNA and RNA helicase
MDGVMEKDMPTSKQKPEAVRQKIRQLENRQKILLNRKADAERKARTHRLIERGAILESVFPEIVSMTGDQVKAFLEEKQGPRKGTG